MFEGKNIHYSTGVDKKALCSFSAKLCRQRRLNGYGFCGRHILEDPSAPYKQCTHQAKNHQQCLNPLPRSSESQFCRSHSQGSTSPKENPNKRGGTMKNTLKLEEAKQNGISADSRLSIQNRLKNKFGRLMNSKNASSDSDGLERSGSDGVVMEDPYAFHDADPPKPVTTAIPPQITTAPGGVLTLQFPIMPSLHTPAVGNNALTQNQPRLQDRASGSVPIAKLYPELAEKLERVRTKTGTDSKSPKMTSMKNASSQRTMHRLQTKIAQNKIKDKLRKSLSTCDSPEQQPSTPLSVSSSESSPSSCSENNPLKDTVSPILSSGPVEIKKTSTWGRKHSASSPKSAGGRSPTGSKSPNGFCSGNGTVGVSTSDSTLGTAVTTASSKLSNSLSHFLQTQSSMSSEKPFAFIQSPPLNSGDHLKTGRLLATSTDYCSVPPDSSSIGGLLRSSTSSVGDLLQRSSSSARSGPQSYSCSSENLSPSNVYSPKSTVHSCNQVKTLSQASIVSSSTCSSTIFTSGDHFKNTFDTDLTKSPVSLASPSLNCKDKKSPSRSKKSVESTVETHVDSKPRCTCVRLKRPFNVLSQAEAAKNLKHPSALKTYQYHARQRTHSADILPMGVDSSDDSEVDDELPWQRNWMLSSSEDEEQDELDEQLASNIRRTKLLLHKSKLRRQFCQLQHMAQGNTDQRKKEVQELRAVLAAAHKSSQLCVMALLEAKRARHPTDTSVIKTTRAERVNTSSCSYRASERHDQCDQQPLPFTNYCQDHILHSTDQLVFDYCTAKFADHTQCCLPVFDCRHELPLCPEHAAKADNYGKNNEPKPKKPRKKTKPSALTRPPKKGKKKKNQRKNSRPQKPISPLRIPHGIDTDTHPDNSGEVSSPTQVRSEARPLSSPPTPTSQALPILSHATPLLTQAPPLATQGPPLSAQSLASSQMKHLEMSQRLAGTPTCHQGDEGLGTPSHDSALDNMDSDFGDDLEQSFSPGTIEKNLGLPLDTEQATNFLDEHDLNDVLNKLPDEAFDLLAGTSDRNGFVDVREEAEVLAQAFAEVSHNFTKDSIDKISQDTGISLTPDPTVTLNSNTTRANITQIQNTSLSNSIVLPGNDHHGDDDLTKQIADSLLREDPLSPTGSISDDLGQDNLNDLASSLSATDLKNISQVLSSCTVLNSGMGGSQTKTPSGISSRPFSLSRGQSNTTSGSQSNPASQIASQINSHSDIASNNLLHLNCQGQDSMTSQGHGLMKQQTVFTAQTLMSSQGILPSQGTPVTLANVTCSFPVFQGVSEPQPITTPVLQGSQSGTSHYLNPTAASILSNRIMPAPSQQVPTSGSDAVSPIHPLAAFSLIPPDQHGVGPQPISIQASQLPPTVTVTSSGNNAPRLMLDAKSSSGTPAGLLSSNGLQPSQRISTAGISVSPSGFKLAYPLQTLIPTPAMLASNLQPGHATLTLGNVASTLSQGSLFTLTTSIATPQASSGRSGTSSQP